MKTAPKNEHLFKTSDPDLVTTLYAMDIPIVGTDYDGQGKCTFSFEDTTAVQDLIKGYLLKQLLITPQSLLEARRTIAIVVHAEMLTAEIPGRAIEMFRIAWLKTYGEEISVERARVEAHQHLSLTINLGDYIAP